jgi:hypothetical protein
MNLNDLTRDELRKRAADLKIPGRGKMLKPELIAAIEAAEAPPVQESAERFEELIAEMREQRDPLAELHRMASSVPTITRKQRQRLRTQPERGQLAGGKVMPLHYRGRAIGAKHLCMRVAAGRSNEEFLALTVPARTA